MIRFSESVCVVPGFAPVDTTTNTVLSDVINAGKTHWVQFIVPFGVITGDTVVVTVEECTDAAATGATAVGFSYRLSSAVGTDLLGAATTVAATGVTIAATADSKTLIVDVDPATLTAGSNYIQLSANPGGSMSVCLISCTILAEPRYAGATAVDLTT